MCGNMVDTQSVTVENRRGKKKEDRNHRAKYNGLHYWAAIKKKKKTKVKPQQ